MIKYKNTISLLLIIAVGFAIYFREKIGAGFCVLIVILPVLVSASIHVYNIFKINSCPACNEKMEKRPKENVIPEFDYCKKCDTYYELVINENNDSLP
jgi:hypothetical protein